MPRTAHIFFQCLLTAGVQPLAEKALWKSCALAGCHKCWDVVSLSFSSVRLPLGHGPYVEPCHFISQVFRDFLSSYLFWFLVWFHYGQRTHAVSFLFLWIHGVIFMPKIWSVLVSVSWAPERISNLLMSGGVFCEYPLYPAVDVAELFCILADFLSSHFVDCWKKIVEISDGNCGFVFSILSAFASHILKLCYLVHNILHFCVFLVNCPFYCWNFPSFLGNFLCSEVYFISAATAAFFWLMSV